MTREPFKEELAAYAAKKAITATKRADKLTKDNEQLVGSMVSEDGDEILSKVTVKMARHVLGI